MVERHNDEGSGERDAVEEAIEEEINTSLDEVLDLLALEVERLKTALDYYRLSNHPDKDEFIRWHVSQIDLRQDRLEEIKTMILGQGDHFVH